MMTTTDRWVGPVLMATLFVGSAGAAVFDDGGEHTIDAGNSFPAESVEVFDGPGDSPTTVNVVDGGDVGADLTAHEHAKLNISGGEIRNSVNAFGDSRVDIIGGEIGWYINAYDNSIIPSSGEFV